MFQINSIQLATGLLYPPAFIERQVDLVGMSDTSAFKREFPNAQLLLTLRDVDAAYNDELPRYYLPFMLQRQPNHIDYYAFYCQQHHDDPKVIVFADHAAVHEWPEFESFLHWLNRGE